MILRQATSGAVVRGNADGDALLWNAAASEWFPGPGGGAPISTVRFADLNAAPGGNGSIGRPFNTITAAVASFGPAPASGLIVAVAGDYTPEGPIALGGVSLTSWIEGGDRTLQISVAALSCTGGGTVQLNGVFCVGNVTFPGGGVLQLTGTSCFFAGDIGSAADAVNAVQIVDFTDSAIFGNVSSTGSIFLDFCQVQAPSLNILQTGTVGTQMQLSDVTWLSTPTLAWPNASVETPPGNVNCDGYTAQPLYQLPATLTHAQLVVFDSQVRVTAFVTVPAVAAGAVGYADLDMTGTLLEDVDLGTPIVVNPTADLVPAGAGGAFVNARCSAPNTVRLAFVGPLAGGAVQFLFSR